MFDLPQQGHDAKATFRQMGVEEGIDGRETVFQLVGYRNGPEFAGLAETVELGIGPVAGQKVVNCSSDGGYMSPSP